MKKIYVILSTFLLLSCSSKKEKIEGYIVFKSYTPKHMCCSNPKTMSKDRPIPPNEHTHIEQESRFTLHIGNKNGTISEDVSKDCYNSFDVLDKVLVSNDGIQLVKKGCK
jgi:hypothetical protein